jgi:carbonic anhydrase
MPKNIGALIKGYQKFRKQYFSGNNSVFEELVRFGQSPKALIIACSDSRVDPALVMNCEPGDLFVVRNVANLVPPYQDDNTYHGTSAALEFAVKGLAIHHIIVFGHSQCGGISALMEQETITHSQGFVAKWMDLASSAYEKTCQDHPEATLEEKAEYCGHYAIINSLNNLMTFPWIQKGVEQKTLFIHGWFFNLSTGMINAYDFQSGQFEELKEIKETPDIPFIDEK